MAVRVACARDFVFTLLGRSVCSDCGERDLATLEFDHVSGKDFGISAAVGVGMRLQRLTAELDRCEVVCASCHRRRTIERGDHWRCRETDAEVSKPRHRQRAVVRQVLTGGRCLDCSEDDMRVLEFDHVRGDKLASIAQLVATEANLIRLRNEIAKCEIVCANCHRRRTARRAGWKRLSWVPALE